MSMRRVLVLVVIVSLASVTGIAMAQTSLAGNNLTGLLLTWQDDPTTTMTIDWHWLDPRGVTEPILRYRPIDDDLWLTAEGSVLRPILPARVLYRTELTDLTPDTVYEFVLSGDDTVYRFRTMPQTLREPLRFAIGGDTRHRQDWMEEMNRVAMEYDPAFIVWGGDLAYADGVRADFWLEWFAAVKNTLIKDDGTVVPVVAGIGNHEVQQHWYHSHEGYEETDAWRERIAPFFYGLLAFPGHPGYDVLDFGDYLSLIVLDTDHTNSVTGVQTDWLEEVLSARQDVTHLIPVYHVTAFPSVRSFTGTTETRVRETWLPLFEQYGVRLAFENHDHAFKRTVPIRDGVFDPGGIVYFGDGAWGVTPRDIHSVPNTWYLDRAMAIRFGMIVTIDEDEVHVVSVAHDGTVIDEYTVNGLYIESPANGSTVGADEPIRLWIDPELDVAELRVEQNGVELHRGAMLPDALTLSPAVVSDDARHRLTVSVTDRRGRTRQQSTDFSVQRVYMRSPGNGVRVRGEIPVQAAIGLGPDETITRVELSAQLIRAFEETDIFSVFEADGWVDPFLLNTLDLEDGTYDLTLTVSTDSGQTNADVRRIIVRNWDVLTEPFEPPTLLFGLSFDRLKTTDRSDGWVSVTDNPGDFHGDSDRLAPTGAGDNYITWQHPRLRRVAITLYASDQTVVDRIALEASNDNMTWHSVPFAFDVGPVSDAGWLQLTLRGEIDADRDANYIRFTWHGMDVERAESEHIQLGHAEFVGTSG